MQSVLQLSGLFDLQRASALCDSASYYRACKSHTYAWAAPAGRFTGIKLRGDRVRFRALECRVNELHVRAAIRLAAPLVQRTAADAKVAVLITACALKSSAQAGFDPM